MSSPAPRLLFAGQKLKAITSLMERLEARGCEWEFVETAEDARRSMDRKPFDVILVDSQLPDGAAYSLIRMLLGTRSSLFFWVPMERSGCLLPIVLRGRHQLSSNALRPPAFSEMLSSLLWQRPENRQMDPDSRKETGGSLLTPTTRSAEERAGVAVPENGS
jgi:DNA-binding NtrC family response regulator